MITATQLLALVEEEPIDLVKVLVTSDEDRVHSVTSKLSSVHIHHMTHQQDDGKWIVMVDKENENKARDIIFKR